MTLAEGVETYSELKYVVQMGVDLIQGYYTARPSFDIIDEIDPHIQAEIINSNVRGQTQSTRKGLLPLRDLPCQMTRYILPDLSRPILL